MPVVWRMKLILSFFAVLDNLLRINPFSSGALTAAAPAGTPRTDPCRLLLVCEPHRIVCGVNWSQRRHSVGIRTNAQASKEHHVLFLRGLEEGLSSYILLVRMRRLRRSTTFEFACSRVTRRSHHFLHHTFRVGTGAAVILHCIIF
jgi:hypothetical protein